MEYNIEDKDWYKKVPPINIEEVKAGSYLLHFDRPVVFDKAHLYGDGKHYIGASVDVFRRINTHRLGLGSQMTKAAIDQGISFEVVAIFPSPPGSRPFDLEKMLTDLGASSYCPRCSAESYARKVISEKKVNRNPNSDRGWDKLSPERQEQLIQEKIKRRKSR